MQHASDENEEKTNEKTNEKTDTEKTETGPIEESQEESQDLDLQGDETGSMDENSQAYHPLPYATFPNHQVHFDPFQM